MFQFIKFLKNYLLKKPGVSSLSLRAIGTSLRNLDSISTDRLDEKLLLLMPSIIKQRDNEVKSTKSSEHLSKSHLSIPVPLPKPKSKQDLNMTTVDLNKETENNVTTTQRDIDQKLNTETLTQVYFKRWIILLTFCFISSLSAFNWIEYNIIQDVTIAFYNQSLPSDDALKNDVVNWLSMIYMLCYIPLVFPAMFLLDRKGLRLSCILGALLTSIGSIIKCAAVRPNLFFLAFIGQTICAIAQSFTLSVPARLSALWFGPSEIATATSVN